MSDTPVVAEQPVSPTDKVPVKFHFKSVEDEATGAKTRRPTVELPLPLVNLSGLIDLINKAEEKVVALIIEAIREVQIAAARGIVNEREDITAENFPYGNVDFTYIANLPAAQRRGAGIPKELFEEFAKDYVNVMPAATGKTLKQVQNAAMFFVAKLNPLKSVPDKNVHLGRLKEQLAIYAASSPNAEGYTDVIEFLNNKADVLMATDGIADALSNM